MDTYSYYQKRRLLRKYDEKFVAGDSITDKSEEERRFTIRLSDEKDLIDSQSYTLRETIQ
jgi:hypothetical protein